MSPIEFDIGDSRLSDIFDASGEIETVVAGLKFLEGPVWHPYENHLRFSDILGNSTFQWGVGQGLTIHRRNSHMANGNTYDRQRRLLSCHHASSRVTRMDDETMTVLASHFQGKELHSPNDIVVKSDDSIYFTDPPYGREAKVGVPPRRSVGLQRRLSVRSGNRYADIANDDAQSAQRLVLLDRRVAAIHQ